MKKNLLKQRIVFYLLSKIAFSQNSAVNQFQIMSIQTITIQGNTYLVAEVDASKCLTSKAMYDELSSLFTFPASASTSYGDVLNDYMNDLGWHKERNFKLIIVNLKKVQKHGPRKVAEIKETFESIKDNWANQKKWVGNQFENDFIVEYRN